MRKIIMLIVLCFAVKANAQLSPWYQNQEKYWYYRYRLVNDFMKIGEGAGESIPCPRRNVGQINEDGDHPGSMEWGSDATIGLGNYISTLATEHYQLQNNGMSTNRTDYELEFALKAFKRLDDNAEEYCFQIDFSYPPNPGNNFTFNKHNGFFIRDDVPYLDWLYKPEIVKHFNRPGIKELPITHQVNYIIKDADLDGSCGGAFDGRFNGIVPGTSYQGIIDPNDFSSGAPRYPMEESQDQLASIWPGLALTSKFVNNAYLKSLAEDELFETIQHIHLGGYIIENPLTGKSVYGIAPKSYNKPRDLLALDAGGFFKPSASPATRALDLIVPSSAASSMHIIADLTLGTLFQVSQYLNFASAADKTSKDLAFIDTYVAFARNWRMLPFINTSWVRIRNHAMKGQFRSPHLPLLYKMNYPKNGVDYCPECHSIQQCDYTIPSYEQLLNWAPPCGPYNYNNNYAHKEWSGNDRLAEPYHRADMCYSGMSYNSDFNGLDYMYLFNLYSLVKENYLGFMINPYYEENFARDYPHNGKGSNSQKLSLNYLEYLSLVNTIHTSGNVNFRGGKVVDLLPGFDAQYDSRTLIYIQDYSCAGGLNNDKPFHYAGIRTRIPETTYEEEEPIEYNPTDEPYNGRFYNSIPPFDYSEDDLGDSIDPHTDSLYMDSLLNIIINSDDSSYHAFYQYYFVNDTSDTSANKQTLLPTIYAFIKEKKANKKNISTSRLQNNFVVNIYPNPNQGIFTITLPVGEDYNISITNAIGITVYESKTKGQNVIEIKLDNGIPPGSYIVDIRGKTFTKTEKISIIK